MFRAHPRIREITIEEAEKPIDDVIHIKWIVLLT